MLQKWKYEEMYHELWKCAKTEKVWQTLKKYKWLFYRLRKCAKSYESVPSRAQHSELLTELSSRFSSRDEFSRVETGRVEHHFFRNFLPKLAKTKNTKKHNFSWFFLRIFAIFRVGTSSEGSDITEIFPKFKKSQFPKLAKTKISEKTV